ncbi:MAG TPA: ATP-binding cassette domain-containing protein [Euzebyales bacterium]
MVLRADADDRRDVDGASACHAEALSKVYGTDDTAVHALRDVTLDIPRRSFTAIMGPSGSGKSTLLHCLAALDTPTSGRVFLGDTELTALSRRRQARVRRDRIGFVFQAYNLVPTLDALENITLPQLLAGRSPDHEWLDHVISRMGLGDRIHHRPDELSGGQQQRIALARALAGRPEVIFADEPTGNLDTTTSGEMLTLLRDAVDQFEQTVVTVTHDPSVARYADQILQFSDGRVVDRHDRRAVGEGSDPHHDSDVAGSGGPDHRGPADTPPRPDGQHTMRSRRRRQPGEPNPGRPMVGSDDEVEVARQERWLQRIREQFEAEQDSDAAFDQGPRDAGAQWDDPPIEQPVTRRPADNAARRRPQHDPEPHPADRSHEASFWQEQQARAEDDRLRAETDDADGHDTRRRFRTPPPPTPAPHQVNGAATNGHHRHAVEWNRDHDPAARDGSRATWNDRDDDPARSTRNGTWGATDHPVAPTDGDWLPAMRSWVDDRYADAVPADAHSDRAPSRGHRTDGHPRTHDHEDLPGAHQHQTDTYDAPADAHQHHADGYREPADTHQHHADSYRRGGPPDGYGRYADPDRRWAGHDHDPEDTYRDVSHDDPDAAHHPTPHGASDQVDAPWSRPETDPLTSTARIGSTAAGPDHDSADPWAPPDARKAEEYRTEQGAVRRGSNLSHDSGDLWATARFDRDVVQAAASTPEEADTVEDVPSAAVDRSAEPVDDPAVAAIDDDLAEPTHEAAPALADHPAEPTHEAPPALAAPSYGPSAQQAGPGDDDSTDRPDRAIHEPATHDLGDDSVGPIDEPTTGGDAAPAAPGVTPAGDDSDQWGSAWDGDADPALDEVWMPTFGHASQSVGSGTHVADSAAPVDDEDGAGWPRHAAMQSRDPHDDAGLPHDREPQDTWRSDAHAPDVNRTADHRWAVDHGVVDDADDAPAPADDVAPVRPRAAGDGGEPRVERSAEPVDEPPVPAPLASLRNTRRADGADDARAALESLQQQLDRLSGRAGRRGGPRPRPGTPRGTNRRPPG